MKKIYFICTGNSCRSQIAEGYAKLYFANQNVVIRSAGVETHGLNPRAVAIMQEDGIDISQQTSDLIDLDYFNQCDLIVTLCGDARDKCPVIPKTSKHLHWDLPDPARATGSDEEIMAVFRQVRNEIKQRVQELIN
ncbi:arsenate reductase (thioredoxin) [Weissella paramesenteroides]|uniref:arsenate reductase (thioredoxin) n=1 Tax=Weissella paramesenteroides TaxID=1249 RepID=UPI00112CC48C|nr:arsenate reductase (thioredoxin) [Weissella paramesenteroides]MBU7556062.1 arsenate reductase (thioredoxin) [Weissella paramesenteroides]TPF03682.1 arsenate reductase (thioredoxin) [Weissella paramesenteroides]